MKIKINYKLHYYAAIMAILAYWIRVKFTKKGDIDFDRNMAVDTGKQRRKVQAWLNKNGFKNVRFIDPMKVKKGKVMKSQKNHTEILCAVKNGIGFIAIRGTDNNYDWKVNFKFKPLSTFMGRVHGAYYEGIEATAGEVEKWLKDYGIKKAVVCGHSKGGGQAQLAYGYYDELFDFCKFVQCVTFGAPRVMKKYAAAAYSKKYLGKVFRYVNNNDVVPKVPGPMIARHVDILMYIDRNGKIRGMVSKWRRFWDGIAGRWLGLGDGLPDGIYDHYPQLYGMSVAKKAKAKDIFTDPLS